MHGLGNFIHFLEFSFHKRKTFVFTVFALIISSRNKERDLMADTLN
jgi:hypothetical protein